MMISVRGRCPMPRARADWTADAALSTAASRADRVPCPGVRAGREPAQQGTSALHRKPEFGGTLGVQDAGDKPEDGAGWAIDDQIWLVRLADTGFDVTFAQFDDRLVP